MSTPKNNFSPKNYISTGISKSLLTPCRRIGLSRSKKTPKNVNVTPTTQSPNISVQSTPVKNDEVGFEVDKRGACLDETPKKLPTPKKVKNSFNKTTFKKLENKISNVDVTPAAQSPNIPVKGNPVKNVEIDFEVDKSGACLDQTPKKLRTPEKVKNHFNKTIIKKVENKISNVDTSPEILKTNIDCDRVLKKIEERDPLTRKETAFNESQIQNSVVTTVTVEVHHPTAKRNINFNKIDKSPTRSPSITTVKEKSLLHENLISGPGESKRGPDLDPIQVDHFKTSEVKEKKRKLRMDSDNQANDTNLMEYKGLPETNLAAKNSSIKKSRTMKTESGKISLAKFTTEDYLKEYSSNPEIFKENFEKDNSVKCEIEEDDDDDMYAFHIPTNKLKINKTNSNDLTNKNSPKIRKKSYVAILCPSIDQSVDLKKSKSLSTKRSSIEPKKLSQLVSSPSEQKPRKELTISLERVKEHLNGKQEGNKEDIQLEELPSTPKLVYETKTSFLRSALYDEDDDHFTSSPDNDKKQRESLLKLIMDIEREIKQKEEKLEKLKQAQVYKKKHSPEKLKISSDRWLEGCKDGLNDLLIKMQEHGPMDMDSLIRNLRIPNDIVDKINSAF